MFKRNTTLPLIGDKSTPLSADSKRIADKALHGIIEPFPKYPDIKFSSNFDWTHKEPELETSYQLYLQNLRVVGTLLAVYEHNHDPALFKVCSEIVNSWIAFVQSGGETKMTWYDHAVGARARVLMQYLCIADEMAFDVEEDEVIEMLHKHAEVLSDDSLHRMNNHGIMMDMALISIGLGMGDRGYFYHGLGRVTSIFWQTFSETGMHQENSPEYHSMVLRMYRELESFLNRNDESLGEGVLAKLSMIQEYLPKIVLPNQTIPGIGDSSAKKTNLTPNWENFHDSMSGFTALKDEKSETYLAFVAGYSATAHKHSDDLSVLLNYKNQDFFVDSGKYNYGKNKYRSYVVSWSAHSSFTPNRAYTRPADNRYSRVIATDKYLETSHFSLVSGYNHGFDGARLRRTVYQLTDSAGVLINDVGSSEIDMEEEWTQRFTLPPEAVATVQPDGVVTISNQGVEITLRWIEGDPNLEVVEGSTSGSRVTAVISPSTKKAVPTTQLVYHHPKSRALDSTLLIELGAGHPTRVQPLQDFFEVLLNGQRVTLPRFRTA